MHACDHIRENLAPFHDGELGAEERAQVVAHLAECEACRREERTQFAVRERLRALRQHEPDLSVPSHIWTNATRAWRLQDRKRGAQVRLRFALVGVCALLFTFGVVWARLAIPTDFPVNRTLDDFRQTLRHPSPPEYLSSDPDFAARWLQKRLHADIPPLNLSLSNAKLVGADVIQTDSGKIGRLLYTGTHGVMALYIAPRHTRFPNAASRSFRDYSFSMTSQDEDVGLYGWEHGEIGFGFAMTQPITGGESYAIDAQRASEHATP